MKYNLINDKVNINKYISDTLWGGVFVIIFGILGANFSTLSKRYSTKEKWVGVGREDTLYSENNCKYNSFLQEKGENQFYCLLNGDSGITDESILYPLLKWNQLMNIDTYSKFRTLFKYSFENIFHQKQTNGVLSSSTRNTLCFLFGPFIAPLMVGISAVSSFLVFLFYSFSHIETMVYGNMFSLILVLLTFFGIGISATTSALNSVYLTLQSVFLFTIFPFIEGGNCVKENLYTHKKILISLFVIFSLFSAMRNIGLGFALGGAVAFIAYLLGIII